MSPLTKELLFMILKFLREENYQETAHSLERESGLFFDMMHFEKMVHNGEWEKAEKYLSGFTEVHDNPQSTRTYFELKKQKFFEALDMKDHTKAMDIIMNEFKVFLPYNENLSKDATMLLTVDDFRQLESLSQYGEVTSERIFVMNALKRIFASNPAFEGKFQFPTVNHSNLLRLMADREETRPSNTKDGVVFPKPN